MENQQEKQLDRGPVGAVRRAFLIAVILTEFLALCAAAASAQAERESRHYFEVFFATPTEGWIGGIGGVLHTTDGGQTWRVQRSEQSPGSSDHGRTRTQFLDAQHGWVLYEGGLYGQRVTLHRTNDGGQTWQVIDVDHLPGATVDESVSLEAFFMASPQVGLGIDPFHTRLLRTDDGGVTWQAVASVRIGAELTALAFADLAHGWVAGTHGVLAVTRNAGQTFHSLPAIPIDRPEHMQFVTPSSGWILDRNGHDFFRTRDGGHTWQQCSEGTALPEVNAFFFRTPDEGWAVGDGGIILRTFDGCATWQRIPCSTTGSLRAIHFPQRDTGWAVGTDDVVLKTVDAGRTWIPVPVTLNAPGAPPAGQALIATVFDPKTGDGGSAIDANLSGLSRLAIDRDGNIFIAGASSIRRIDARSDRIATVAGGGGIGRAGDGASASSAEFDHIAAMCFDGAGNLYVADGKNNRIRRIAAGTGIVTTVATGGSPGVFGPFPNTGEPTAGMTLEFVRDMVADAAGDLFVADQWHHRVRKVETRTGRITTIAGSGAIDFKTGGFSGDGGPATAARLNSPSGLAMDGRGNLFIADAGNHRIRMVDAATGIISTVVGSGPGGVASGAFSGDAGLAAAARLSFPEGLAIASDGSLYIADSINDRIRRVDARTAVITTVAGTGASGRAAPVSGDGGPATSARLDHPSAVAFDVDGNLLVVEEGSGRIRKIALGSGVITTRAGREKSGLSGAGFSGDGGPAAAARLSSPAGLALDTGGNLLFVDLGNNRIRHVALPGGIITTAVGTGRPGFAGDGGPAITAELQYPTEIAVDSDGNLFIADSSNNRIRRVSIATGHIATVAGSGSPGWGKGSFSGDGGPATNATLNLPSGLAFDGQGALFIADTANNRIRRLELKSGIITTVAGTGASGFSGDGGPAGMATLSRPSGVAVTARYLFIATEGRIRRVDRTSGVIATAAGGARRAEFPDREVSGDGGPATGVNLAPSAIAVDRNGDLWIVERWNHRIRRVEAGTDIITTVAGTGIRGYGSDGPGAAKTHLNHPGGIAFDSSGTLFLSDTGNHRVLRVVRATGDISTAAGVGRRAFFSLERAQDSSALQPADLAAVAVDLDGNLYVADRGSNAIRKMSVATGAGVTIAGREDVLTEHKRLFGGDGGPATLAYFSGPSALALDGRGNLFIADTWNHRIRKIVLQTGIVSTVAGLGTDGFSGDGGLATKSSLSSPTGVAADLAGNFFIADTGNHVVRRVDSGTGVISTVAGTGERLFSGDQVIATNMAIGRPSSVAVDLQGNLFIVDTDFNRVLKVDLRTGAIVTVAGNRAPGFSGEGGPATRARLSHPAGVTVDRDGNIYIADAENHRVVRVDAATGIFTTIAGTGNHGFSGDGGPATGARLNNPQGVAVDREGHVYVADTGNHRVRKVELVPGKP